MASKLQRTPLVNRPRERLFRLGAEAISLQELIMILMGSGNKSRPVEHLASDLEQLLTTERGISKPSLLRKIKGLGPAKLAVLLASLELGERVSLLSKEQISKPEHVRGYLTELEKQTKEIVIALYLSARNVVIHKEVLAIGSMNQAILSPREVFLPIRLHPINGIILAHNHPSGDPEPSEDDIRFTKRIQEAGELLGITLLDHIVIGGRKMVSLKQLGYLS